MATTLAARGACSGLRYLCSAVSGWWLRMPQAWMCMVPARLANPAEGVRMLAFSRSWRSLAFEA